MIRLFIARQKGTVVYHLWLLLLQGKKALPPAQYAALRLHQVPTDLVETLLLLRGPVVNPENNTDKKTRYIQLLTTSACSHLLAHERFQLTGQIHSSTRGRGGTHKRNESEV